ncbi:MAG: tetratricopeptide repeat protein [Alphaproteobacteria bacterium]|nr:tetratricopeptide repeat protein [Alphaproteobacteria bacterium]
MAYDNLLQQALELHQSGELDKAEVIYRQIMETAPENTQVMHFLAMIAVAKGAFEVAIDLLYKAIAKDKKVAPYHFNLAMALQGKGFYKEAADEYKTALKLDSSFAPEAYNNIANIYKQKGDFKAAAKAYKDAIKADEKAFYAYNGLGLLLREEGNNAEAMEYFRMASDIAPQVPDSLANLATSLRMEERYTEALAYYDQALEYADAMAAARIYNSKGITLELIGKESEAMNAYQKAISSDAGFADPYAHAGSIFLSQGKLKDAEEMLRKAISLDAYLEDAFVNLGVVLYKSGLYMEAMENYRQAILLNPKNPEVCNNLAIAVHTTGDLQEAAGLCFNVIAIDAKFAPVHNTLANILNDMFPKDKDTAIEIAKAWLKHVPDNPIAKHTLASFTKDKKLTKASKDYVRELFDGFADTFDAHLEGLDYCVPDLFAQKLQSTGKMYDKVLDLGSGTGLSGKAIRPFAKHLTGVDISEKMLAKAENTRLYDDLQNAEINAYLATKQNAFDLIIAGDVMEYFGDLAQTLALMHEALKANGTVLFTTEENAEADTYEIKPYGRFAHGEEYLRRVLGNAGFKNPEISKVVLRKENYEDVAGLMIYAQK